MKNFILHISLCFLSFLVPVGSCLAQDEDDQEPTVRLVYHSSLVGVGLYSVRDTYLSPFEYTGKGVRIVDERMRMTGCLDGKVSTQQLINIDFSSSKNLMETASNYTLMLDYSYGAHYHFRPLPKLRMLTGAQANLHLGAIYNTRNGNNPVSAKAGLNLNLSGIADYQFKIKQQPVSIRYQGDWSLVGGVFSPHYGQSYYEISLGNHDGLVRFTHPGNQLFLKNYLTVEVPVRFCTMRLTYLNSIYQTNVSALKTQIRSNTIMIGIVKEIFSMPAKKPIGKTMNGVNYRRVYDDD